MGDLLTLAPERERPRGERLSLAAVAEAARERWHGPAESTQHQLRLAGRAEVAVVASRDDLAVMLDNMIENALNYSPPGTTVSLDWGVDGALAELAVLDEGPGIGAEESARVFERFYRGSAGRDAPGTGLGLPVVQALAERWGGQASLAGRPEGGTRAAVTLPAAGAARGDLPSLDGVLDESLPGRG